MYRNYQGLPLITVVNNSANEMRNVVLSGPGWSSSIPVLEPAQSTTVFVQPKGESGLKISFQTSTESVEKDDLAYIETRGGYCVTLTIAPDLTITSEGGQPCFSLRRAV